MEKSVSKYGCSVVKFTESVTFLQMQVLLPHKLPQVAVILVVVITAVVVEKTEIVVVADVVDEVAKATVVTTMDQAAQIQITVVAVLTNQAGITVVEALEINQEVKDN
jgi:hypothetical protein